MPYFVRLQPYPRGFPASGGYGVVHDHLCQAVRRAVARPRDIPSGWRGPFADVKEAVRSAAEAGFTPMTCRLCEPRMDERT